MSALTSFYRLRISAQGETPKGYDSIRKIFENAQVHPVGIVMTYKCKLVLVAKKLS